MGIAVVNLSGYQTTPGLAPGVTSTRHGDVHSGGIGAELGSVPTTRRLTSLNEVPLGHEPFPESVVSDWL